MYTLPVAVVVTKTKKEKVYEDILEEDKDNHQNA